MLSQQVRMFCEITRDKKLVSESLFIKMDHSRLKPVLEADAKHSCFPTTLRRTRNGPFTSSAKALASFVSHLQKALSARCSNQTSQPASYAVLTHGRTFGKRCTGRPT